LSRVKGSIAEDKAVLYLKSAGHEIIERNFYSKFGEIDIISVKDKVLHFIEVKSGVNFEPVYAITPKKLDKIIKTINYYMLKKKINPEFSVDAIIIRKKEIEFLENITLF